MQYELNTPCTAADLAPLKAGDTVLLSGVVYTARDQAHKRMLEALDRGEKAPLRLGGQRHLLRRPDAGASRRGHRLGRADHQRTDGRHESPPAGPRQ